MRWVVALITVVFLVFAFMSAYFFIDTAGMERSFKEICNKKELELKTNVEEVKLQIKKDMNDKYKDSFAALEKTIKDFKNEKAGVKNLSK